MTPSEAEVLYYGLPLFCWTVFGGKIYFSILDTLPDRVSEGREIKTIKFIIITLLGGPGAWFGCLAMLACSICMGIGPTYKKFINKCDSFIFTKKEK